MTESCESLVRAIFRPPTEIHIHTVTFPKITKVILTTRKRDNNQALGLYPAFTQIPSLVAEIKDIILKFMDQTG